MELTINNEIKLTEYRSGDKSFLIKFLNEFEIFKNTFQIPYPYGEKEADFWLNLVKQKYDNIGDKTEFAIRNGQEELIGGIGRLTIYGLEANIDEIGYWLAKPYWNRGIMTQVVNKFSEFSFKEFSNLQILIGRVFHYNYGSSRVLEKCGYVQVDYLKKAYNKNGTMVDAVVFQLARHDRIDS